MLSITREHNILTLKLNRPQVRNALNSELVRQILAALAENVDNDDVRVIVLRGEGKGFCSGGDINWLKELGKKARDSVEGRHQNLEEARHLEKLFYTVNSYPKPVLGVVHGVAMGGGFGLTSVCDYVVASKNTIFSLSELRIGIVPSVILPFVMDKIGESQTRALMLSGQKFNAEKALSIGLVHKVVQKEQDLESEVDEVIKGFIKSGPEAIARAKKLLCEIKSLPKDQIREHVSKTLAEVRATDEAQEGLLAFLEKRFPSWIQSI